jgi:hypothetical protein
MGLAGVMLACLAAVSAEPRGILSLPIDDSRVVAGQYAFADGAFDDDPVPETPRRDSLPWAPGPAAPGALPAPSLDPLPPGAGPAPLPLGGDLPGGTPAPLGPAAAEPLGPAAEPPPLRPQPRRPLDPSRLPPDPAYPDPTLPPPESPFLLEPEIRPRAVERDDVGLAEACGAYGYASMCHACDPACAGCDPWTGGPVQRWARGILYEAWLQQGVTINTLSPRNRSNYPVGFNDGSNEYQMNQLYLVLDKPVDESACGWDVGGRIDFLYGTDHRFTSARGLETRRDGSPKWSSEDYGLSMPQLYAEVFAPWWNGIRFKLGHFYTIFGYETVPAVENFFYSHSYAHQFGEPFTHTGLLATTPMGPFTLHAGFSRGWDNWEDNNNDLDFLGGISWASRDRRIKLLFALSVGREQDEPPPSSSLRTAYSMVGIFQVTDRLEYVIQHNLGIDEGAAANRTRDANWFGLNQYLFYTINPCWKAGIRFEWFRDEDAHRIDPVFGADYYALTLGLNYQPNDWFICRPELRWDWAKGLAPGYRPFGDGTEMHQLLLAFDAIVRF